MGECDTNSEFDMSKDSMVETTLRQPGYHYGYLPPISSQGGRWMSATLSLVKILFTYFVTTFSLSYYQEGGGHNGSQVVAGVTGPPTHLLGVGRGNLTTTNPTSMNHTKASDNVRNSVSPEGSLKDSIPDVYYH